MRPDENCDQCKFHLVGFCRRMPPAAHDGGRIGGLPIAVWPLVRPTDWCGEFRRRTPDPPAQIARATSPGRLGMAQIASAGFRFGRAVRKLVEQVMDKHGVPNGPCSHRWEWVVEHADEATSADLRDVGHATDYAIESLTASTSICATDEKKAD